MRKANAFILMGKNQKEDTKHQPERVPGQGWTFQLGIICWVSKSSVKPATVGWLKVIEKKGEKSHKYISRKNVIEGDRTFEKVVDVSASQQVKLYLHELGRAIVFSCAAFPSRSLKSHSP